ncbi:Gfo/Idh/MocA family protein [Paenibacillus koleovorans]|uniref:Gfo/Idh/MocA family protein n=1 Tax=Paenibacillus koleovorans TaxID=121608 RepID=UPI000FD9B458|nr:Gfo/Idh/MocA family oxidoreductase [Paenibacillus koleovorans]
MKIAVIGSTGHTGYVLKGLRGQADAELVGIAPGSVGEDIEVLYEYALKQGLAPRKFEQYRDMLDQVKPDVVAVACYFNDHAAVAVEVLSRGIHLFVEKPVATTLQDLEKVKAAHEKSGAQLAAMFGIRYSSWFLTVQRLIQEGRIGEIRMMNAQKSYRLGERSELYRRRETYGGTIPWVGSHAIDWMYSLCGESFVSVFASHSTRANRGHGELETTGLCHFTFTNEVFGSVNIDYLRPQQAPTHADDRIRIAGSNGVLEVVNNQVLLINGDADGIQHAPLLSAQESFTDFLQQVRGSSSCLVTAEQSFTVTEACLRARMSADKGRVVYF